MRTKTAGKSCVTQFLVRSAAGYGAAVILCVVFAEILVKKDVPLRVLPFFLIASGAIGSFAGAFLAAGKTKYKGYFSGLLSAGIVSFLFLLTCFIVNNLHFSIYMLWILIAGLFCGMAGGIVSKNVR